MRPSPTSGRRRRSRIRAAIRKFGASLRYAAQKTIWRMFFPEVTKNRESGLRRGAGGVISTEGVVTHTLDMFVDSELKIVAQIILRIQHCLVSRFKRNQIKKLYAHPQSLAQCRAWVQNHLADAEIIETSSNSRSAELAAKEKNSAAITGVLAAERYNLPILENDIQDNSANATRFLVLGRQCSPPTGRDRTSLMLSITHEVGALHRALAAFRRFKLNMVKIESRPSKRKAWEYYFFIDCTRWYKDDRKVAKCAIAALQKECNFVKVLGSYPNGE